ncbi:hypothetical protein N783_11355, partial [Pontibacillus marinus BH030004 = DSM 16465]
MKKKFVLPLIFIGVFILLTIPARFLWSEQESFEPPNEKSPIKHDVEVVSLQKDKSRYKPGSDISFQAFLSNKPEHSIDMKVEFYHLGDKIHEKIIQVSNKKFDWTWTPPEEDFQGYLVKVSPLHNQDSFQTIAVDVSSSWGKFPRYGFLSSFEKMDKGKQSSVINTLSRFHINGIQFYGWLDEYHLPLNDASENWNNMANQKVNSKTIKTYIDLAHQKNMNAMSYNLINGTLDDAEKDGVQPEWYLYRDKQQENVDSHNLPDNWKSDIYLTNPANGAWQNYIFNNQKTAFEHLPFDGWHIDQLGNRGKVYDSSGERIQLPNTYKSFLQNARRTFEDKDLVMNAVNQYGQEQIAQSPVPFMYTELWDPARTYTEIENVIKENNKLSNGEKNTVIAGYMNNKKSNGNGKFNTPGILYTDALLFAQGGAHIELGEHMLSKDYFPHHTLHMSDELTQSLKHYYDFMVAYENLLRDGLQEAPLTVSTSNWVRLSDRPEKGKVYAFAKESDKKKVIHLINYFNARHMNWRDAKGTQSEPSMKRDLTLYINETKEVKNVWVASPDWNKGLPQKLEFEQEDGEVHVNVPRIKYWDMVVFE